MHRKTRLCTLIAGLCLAGGALAQGAQPTTPSTPAAPQAERDRGPMTGQPGAGQKESTLSGDDRDFLRQAAQNGMAELEASKLAQQKATNPEVKSFAAKMVEEHTRTNQELMQLAQSKGVELPDKPSLLQRAKLRMLAGAEGEKFDQRYAENYGVEAHEDTIELFQEASEEAQDPEVKQFAQKTLSSLQEHLNMAQSVHGQVQATAEREGGADEQRGAAGRSADDRPGAAGRSAGPGEGSRAPGAMGGDAGRQERPTAPGATGDTSTRDSTVERQRAGEQPKQ